VNGLLSTQRSALSTQHYELALEELTATVDNGGVKPGFSIVIPVHNEEPHLLPLYGAIREVMEARYPSFEIIFVDDASTDASFRLLEQMAQGDQRVTVVRLRRNFGQSAALAAGFDAARGDIVIAMDGDLQHDPADIPKLVEKMNEGYDLVSGWRHPRVDNFLTRRLPSTVANWCMAQLSGIPIHDFGTTFKAYRREVIEKVNLYGDLHRFIPALADLDVERVSEVPIRNVPRPAGRSHYGLGRTSRVLFDLVTVRFLRKYLTRPLHFFGKLGLLALLSGGGCLAYVLLEKLRGEAVFVEHGPLLLTGFLLALAGVQLICTGLIGEMVMRTYFESQKRRVYSVAQVVSRRGESEPSQSAHA
jgi:glycosyltransferase involved in cell wall biosynthesis